MLDIGELIKINRFRYFLPKKYGTYYQFPTGETGTAQGDFYTYIEYNELGLIKNIEKDFPGKTNNYMYEYNTYGQLLKKNSR